MSDDREAAARIIDPEAFKSWGQRCEESGKDPADFPGDADELPRMLSGRRTAALTKADAILALLSEKRP